MVDPHYFVLNIVSSGARDEFTLPAIQVVVDKQRSPLNR
jgi:hypothetical protein